MTTRRMTTAEMQALARRKIADALAEGEAGRLDNEVFEALKAALADRLRAARKADGGT